MRFLIALACLALASHPLASQVIAPGHGRRPPTKRPMMRLAGSWRLVATRQRMTNGTVRPDPDLGANPSGYLMFDADAAQMCTVVNNGDRARWAVEWRRASPTLTGP